MGVTHGTLKPLVKSSGPYHEMRWNVGFLAVVLIMAGPHRKDFDPHRRIRFLHVLREARPVCKTRNQFTGNTLN
jgi:hypothetical protein